MLALSNELEGYFKDFCFVASEKLEEKYKNLGFSDLNNKEFVFKAYEDPSKAREIILNADVVITGSYVYQSHIRERINKGKAVIINILAVTKRFFTILASLFKDYYQ